MYLAGTKYEPPPRLDAALGRAEVMKSGGHDIIVIGTSAGGVDALRAVASALPADLPAAVLVAMHVPAWRPSDLPQILNKAGPLPALHPNTGDPIEHGKIYVAPPDLHLQIDSGDRIQLWRGPKENNFRPSINALFRSAAVAYGPRVTGVILTGALDDGVTGLWWVKRMGGAAVVQDPNDARFDQMPRTALWHVPVDYVVKAAGLAPLLTDLARGIPREVFGPREGIQG